MAKWRVTREEGGEKSVGEPMKKSDRNQKALRGNFECRKSTYFRTGFERREDRTPSPEGFFHKWGKAG